MVVEADPSEAVATVEGFVGRVVGPVAGRCEEMVIPMGAGAGAG